MNKYVKTKTEITMHRGQHIRKKIKESGLSIRYVSEKLNVTRPTLYKWFTAKNLGSHQMVAVAKVINYNIFVDFPEMENLKEEKPVDFEDIIYKNKYFQLLEKHLDLRESVDEILGKQEKISGLHRDLQH